MNERTIGRTKRYKNAKEKKTSQNKERILEKNFRIKSDTQKDRKHVFRNF